MASSSRRVFIGYLVLAKAARAGGSSLEATKRTPSRPPLTAVPVPMIGNSGAPRSGPPGSPGGFCEGLVGLGCGAESASRLGTYFFRKWSRGGRGPGASPGVTNPPPGPPPPRRLAAQGGGREGGALYSVLWGTGLIGFTITTHYRSITTHYHPLPPITAHHRSITTP
jgi:hypothetical protein